MKERTFYTINLDSRRIAILVMILVLLLVYSFILGHTIGKRKGIKEALESSEKTETNVSKLTTSTPTPTRPTIKSDEEASIDAQEEIAKQKRETIPLKSESRLEETEEAPQKSEIEQKKKKPKKKSESGEFFTIQLGAFGTEEQAQKFKEKVLSQSKVSGGRHSLKIEQRGELFVVTLGRYPSKEEANQAKNKLDPDFQTNAFVRPSK